MARYRFGGSIADWPIRLVTTSEAADLAQVVGGVEVTFWADRTGDSRHTDLLDLDGQPITSVFVTNGVDGSARGQIPQFHGPDGVTAMWASADGGPRALIATYDLPFHVHDAAEIVSGVLDPARLPEGIGGGIGDPGTLWVAAVDAPAAFADAQYVCDGVDDQVQIQAALNDANGRIIRLSPGTFQLSAPVVLQGGGGGEPVEKTLIGYGATVTTLAAAAGITAAIEMTARIIPHLAHFGITVDGATHGIAAAPLAGSGSSLGVSGGTFSNVRVLGTWDSAQTGWGLHLNSPFESRFTDIVIEGTANGVRIFSSAVAGSLWFDRLFVDLTGQNRRALSVEALGSMVISDVHVNLLEAVGDGSGGTAVVFAGSSGGSILNSSVRNASISWFDRLVNVQSGRDNLFDVLYGELNSFSNLTAVSMDMASWNNTVNLNNWYVPLSATLLNDGNTGAPQLPNRVGKANVFTESSATVTYTPNAAGTTLLGEVVDRGLGTITSVRRTPLARAPHAVINLGNSGTSVITLDGARGSHWRIVANGNFTLANPINLVDGQLLYLDVTQDATGTRTMTLGTKFRFSTTFPNATLTTTANKKDKLTFQYNVADDRLDIIHFIKGI